MTAACRFTSVDSRAHWAGGSTQALAFPQVRSLPLPLCSVPEEEAHWGDGAAGREARPLAVPPAPPPHPPSGASSTGARSTGRGGAAGTPSASCPGASPRGPALLGCLPQAQLYFSPSVTSAPTPQVLLSSYSQEGHRQPAKHAWDNLKLPVTAQPLPHADRLQGQVLAAPVTALPASPAWPLVPTWCLGAFTPKSGQPSRASRRPTLWRLPQQGPHRGRAGRWWRRGGAVCGQGLESETGAGKPQQVWLL